MLRLQVPYSVVERISSTPEQIDDVCEHKDDDQHFHSISPRGYIVFCSLPVAPAGIKAI